MHPSGDILIISLAFLLMSCNQIKDEGRIDSVNFYQVIWKYKIKPEHKVKFELEYGSEGAWSKLFAKSENYKGSYLYKSEDEANTYLLIDTWLNKATYDDFKRMNREVYDQLSADFEYLYEAEEKIGSFNPIL